MFKQLQAELALAHNIHFNDVSLLEEALTQANYINEHPNYTGRDYQRLEFLGDAVMQQSTAVYLFKRYPDWDEGRLTELRISMVQTRAFAALSRELHLDQYVQLDVVKNCPAHETVIHCSKICGKPLLAPCTWTRVKRLS